MRKALEFLATHKDVAMATVEGNKPKIRVFQIMAIELLAMEGNISVRITGKAVFDVSDPVQKEIYETNAVLLRLYPSYLDMVYFRLTIEELDYYDLTLTPPLLEHYENRH